jgi:hypothetical protein
MSTGAGRDEGVRGGSPHDGPADRPVPPTQHDDRDEPRPGRRAVDEPADRRYETAMDRDAVVAREKEAYGGIKLGSAFFGWLTATGMAVLLTAVLTAAGTAVSLATDTTVEEATADPETVGLVGGAVLLVIVFVAYFSGGYVAGRMARFNGALQGVAVWVWAVLVAVLVVVLGAVAGDSYNVLVDLNAFPRIPVNEGDLSTAGIVVAVAVAVVSLLGAVLGGVTGMRYHRKVDEAGLGR